MKEKLPLVITISRQLGCGGAYVGQQLAKKLNIFYADREIINQAAKKLSVLEEDIENMDEKRSSFWKSFLEACMFCSPEAYVPPYAVAPTDRELHKVESEIIEHIAQKSSAVIIGRCGSHILRNHPNHVSVFLHGDIEFRKKRIQELYNVIEGTASNMIAKSDAQRSEYHRTFTGKKWVDATQYDISIDTSKVSLDKAVELIIKYVYSI